MIVTLKPYEQRGLTASEVIDRLRPKLNAVPGARLVLYAVQNLKIGARTSTGQYQYTLRSDSVSDLVQWGPILFDRMKKLPELTDVDTDQQNSGLEARLVYDRNTAARLGITTQLIDSTLYNAFGQSQVSTMYTPLNQYHVVMEVAPRFWQDPRGLDYVYIRTSSGKVVPLSVVAHFEKRIAPLAVNHDGQFPAVTISFNLPPGIHLSDADRVIDQTEQDIGMPSSIRGMYSGQLQAFQDSISTEPLLIVTALLTVYIVLGMLYESYIHPITILSTLPSAGVGAVLALMIFHMDLDVIGIVGIILLIGLVKKNAILMIDFALATQRSGHRDAKSAIHEACLLRFRPILMTTMAALLGALPLALAKGVGSELRVPLGVTIIGGLIFSQMLTLFTTPVVYLYMDRFGMWSQQRNRSRHSQDSPAGSRLTFENERDHGTSSVRRQDDRMSSEFYRLVIYPVIRPPLLALRFIFGKLYSLLFGRLDIRAASKNQERLAHDVRASLSFLFSEHGARIVLNEGVRFPPPMDYAVVTLSIGNMFLRFVRGDGSLGVQVSPERMPQDWHELSQVLRLNLCNRKI